MGGRLKGAALSGDLMPNVAIDYRLRNGDFQDDANIALGQCGNNLNTDTYQGYYASVEMLLFDMGDSNTFYKKVVKLLDEFWGIPNKQLVEEGGPTYEDFTLLKRFHWKLKEIIANSGHNDFKFSEEEEVEL